jgi:hypothetical protein
VIWGESLKGPELKHGDRYMLIASILILLVAAAASMCQRPLTTQEWEEYWRRNMKLQFEKYGKSWFVSRRHITLGVIEHINEVWLFHPIEPTTFFTVPELRRIIEFMRTL